MIHNDQIGMICNRRRSDASVHQSSSLCLSNSSQSIRTIPLFLFFSQMKDYKKVCKQKNKKKMINSTTGDKMDLFLVKHFKSGFIESLHRLQ